MPTLVQLLALLFNQEVEFSPNADAQQRGLQQILDNPSAGVIWVAEHQGKVVGMVNLLFSISTALGEPVATLEDLVIAPEMRRQGLGATLLNSVIGFASKAGFKRITLLTDKDNSEAQAFYQKMGFTHSSMIPMRKFLSGGNA